MHCKTPEGLQSAGCYDATPQLTARASKCGQQVLNVPANTRTPYAHTQLTIIVHTRSVLKVLAETHTKEIQFVCVPTVHTHSTHCSWPQEVELVGVNVVTNTLEGDADTPELAVVSEEKEEENEGHGPLSDCTGDVDLVELDREGEGQEGEGEGQEGSRGKDDGCACSWRRCVLTGSR